MDFLKKLIAPPIFTGDEEKTRKAALLHGILLLLSALMLFLMIGYLIGGTTPWVTIVGLMIAIGVFLAAQIPMRRGYIHQTSSFIIVFAQILIAITMVGSGTIRVIGITFYLLITMTAGLLISNRAAVITSIINTLIVAGLGWAEVSGRLPEPIFTVNITQIITFAAASILTGVLLNVALRDINHALNRAKESENNLTALNQELEKRVAERTNELELQTAELDQQRIEMESNAQALAIANEKNEKRAKQFEAITEISGTIADVHILADLLPGITKVVSEKLNYYHTGIFLLDDARKNAILVASNSTGGQRMLKRGHRLAVGKVGLVGNVAQTGNARIALDTGEDATYFNNPDLPETHSEIALPLKTKTEIIGVLDVQSTEKDAFGQDDIAILSTLADQISIAIENARLFETTQKSLAEAEAIYRQFIQTEWTSFSKTRKVSGYQYTLTGIAPTEAVDEETANQIAAEGITIQKNENSTMLAVPITLRGEVIGVLDVQAPGERKWQQDEIDIAQAIAERVAISAENARLFEQTSERAERERAVSMITTKIRSTNDPNEMLAIAVNEIKAALNAKDIRIQKAEKQAAENPAKSD